ncbi:MAG: Hsp33 family molecular chaperone HslO [Proteobacteria bacterium]|nr:Hsp33 family molecular chaperone HslO [Pseudomonadota bacterium]MDA1355123.1 Hsp33 family molecular chaperone HslO [Pseudomonadota bacterium]
MTKTTAPTAAPSVAPTIAPNASPDDFVRSFRLDKAGVRGRQVRLGNALNTVLVQHDYPAPVSRLLGELIALSTLLASTIKYDGVFTVQTRGDGPLSMMVADITSSGTLRGYADFDSDALAAALAAGEEGSVPRLLGAGHLAFTVDQGPDTERYQGIVALEGATLSECAHNYFRQSEQIATAIQLAAECVSGGWRGGALMLQHEPGGGGYDRPLGRDALPDTPGAGLEDQEANEDWRRAVILMSSVTPVELLDPALGSDTLLFRLFHEESVRVHPPRRMAFGCRCSRDRVENTLKALPQAEIRALNIDGRVVVTCQFCNKSESFADIELDAIYAA